MAKITYLFGAGASCKALPMVKEIPDRLQATIDVFSNKDYELEDVYFEGHSPESRKTKNGYQQELIEGFKWLKDKSTNHASIDTFAKKLYLGNTRQDDHDLKKLKICLSIFFILEQYLKKPDSRYDTFYASLLNARHDFPSNIRVLSWNYDYQFELAYSEYSGDKTLSANNSHLRVLQKFSRKFSPNSFSIIKLNGTTEFHTRDLHGNDSIIIDSFHPTRKEMVEILTKQFAFSFYHPKLYSSLSFAWERDFQQPDIIEQAITATSDNEILVVIGYSFPFFNREVDRKIIKSMTGLKKVYFQAPDANNLIERFQAIREDIDPKFLVPKFDTEQFFLPNEL